MKPITVNSSFNKCDTWEWMGAFKPPIKTQYVDHSTGVSWAGLWIAIASMNITSQLIAAGIV